VAPVAPSVSLARKLVEAEVTDALGGQVGRAFPFLPRAGRDLAGGALVDRLEDLVDPPG
jgi:hypothetical protein